MNKKISFLLLCVLVALTLILPCSADESELVTDIVTETVDELVTDVETAPEVDAPVVDNTVDNTVTDTPTEEAVTAEWEVFKAKITDTATWTMIGAGLLTAIATIGVVKKKFGVIVDAFNSVVSLLGIKKGEGGEGGEGGKDGETVVGAIKKVKSDLVVELKSAYKEEFENIRTDMQYYKDELKNKENNEQRLYAILTLFMTNCKISDSAKAEILNILADVKKYEGDIIEVVSQAQEAIDKEVEEQLKIAEPTPTLDKLLEEEYMELG